MTTLTPIIIDESHLFAVDATTDIFADIGPEERLFTYIEDALPIIDPFVPGEIESPFGANLSNGNRTYTATVSGASWVRIRVDRPKTTGKWFFAVELTNIALTGGTNFAIGTSSAALTSGTGSYIPGAPCELKATFGGVGKKWIDNTISNFGAAIVTGNIIGIGYDADTGDVTCWRYSGGTWVSEGSITTITPGSTRRPIIDANCQITGPSVFTLRSDLSVPAGFELWA